MPIEIVNALIQAGIGLAALIVLFLAMYVLLTALRNSGKQQQQGNDTLQSSLKLFSEMSLNVNKLADAVTKLGNHDAKNTEVLELMGKHFAESTKADTNLTARIEVALTTVPPLIQSGTAAAEASKLASENTLQAVNTLVTKLNPILDSLQTNPKEATTDPQLAQDISTIRDVLVRVDNYIKLLSPSPQPVTDGITS